MKLTILKLMILVSVMLGFVSANALADEIDDALIAAYEEGYKDGYAAAKVVQLSMYGTDIPPGSGGTSGKEVPWVYSFDSSTNTYRLFERESLYEFSAEVGHVDTTEDLLEAFNSDRTEKGVIIIEDMPMTNFYKLEEALKNSRSGNIWISPVSGDN